MNELRELLELAKMYVTMSYIMSAFFIIGNLIFIFRKPINKFLWRLKNRKVKEIEDFNYEEFSIETNEEVKKREELLNKLDSWKPRFIQIAYGGGYDIYELTIYDFHKYYDDNSIYILHKATGEVFKKYSNCQTKFY